MENNKLAIAFCVHHKPWLIMSTLITLALQDYRDFDAYFLYQLGDGSCPQKKTYEEYFRLSEKYGRHSQLSPYDERVKLVVNQVGFKNILNLDLENDHALDSGVWYKFIKTKKWEKYDYVFCIQEGTVFTRGNVLSCALDFIRKNNIHFLASGHEKRKLPKNALMDLGSRKSNPSELDFFYDKKQHEVFDIFCRDLHFKELYNKWDSDFNPTTQNHVPDIVHSYLERVFRIITGIKRRDLCYMFGKTVYENAWRRCLKDVVGDYVEQNKVIFHKDNELLWYGGSCQHLFSRKFLESFTGKIAEYNLYEALDIPYSGEILEVIWGFLPNWLGFDKWFFDGIHRIRKDFVTYKREDSPDGMCSYINSYFKGKIIVVPEGEFIKIKKLNKRLVYLREVLGDIFF